jgi:hypothetical protein
VKDKVRAAFQSLWLKAGVLITSCDYTHDGHGNYKVSSRDIEELEKVFHECSKYIGKINLDDDF